jgi:hypothetical protein
VCILLLMASHELDFTFSWSAYLSRLPVSRWMTPKTLRRKTRSHVAQVVGKERSDAEGERQKSRVHKFPLDPRNRH